MTVYTGNQLESVDLIVDAVYSGFKTPKGGIADPLVKLVGVSRQGGFRYRGTWEKPTLLVLTSNLAEPDWPDELDEVTGRFIYYGDNRQPGQQLHDTPRFGNHLLKTIFDLAHRGCRELIPPILIFTKEEPGRSFRFRGLAVPGHQALSSTEDLVAVWKSSQGQRFQNYRAVFTILDEPVIWRDWIHSVGAGLITQNVPERWKSWVATGQANALEAPRTQQVRSKSEQLPYASEDQALISVIRERYRKDAFGFEVCAGALTRLLLGDVSALNLTRPWRDGGRDGIGKLRVGRGAASIEVVFALEAKCYGETKSVGVKDTSRLISRIRHRQFGVLVTTSYIHDQAYGEVTDDEHPVIFVTSVDIVGILRSAGYGTPAQVSQWLAGLHTD